LGPFHKFHISSNELISEGFPVRLGGTIATMVALMLLFPIGAVTGEEGGAGGRVADNDNDFANATAAGSGNSYGGDLSSADDLQDFFKVQSPGAGQVFNVSVFVDSYPAITVKLTAYDPAGVMIDESYLAGQIESLSILAVKSNADYFFVVTRATGAAGMYTLSYLLEVPVTLQGGNTVEGSLARASNNTADWYVFAMTGGTNLGNNNDYCIHTLYKSGGLTLDVYIYALWTELTGYTLNISLNHVSGGSVSAGASYTGSYYVRVYSRTGSGTYNITMGVLQSCLNDKDQDGNSATKLKNAPINSWLDQAFDHYDFYKLYLPLGTNLDVTMTLNSYTPGKYVLWMYHIVGGLYTLVTNSSNFVVGQGWTNQVRLQHQSVLANRYYIIAMAEHGLTAQGALSSTPANASYTLLLSQPMNANNAPILKADPGYPNMNEDTEGVIFNLNNLFDEPDSDMMWYNVTGSAHINATLKVDGSVWVKPVKDWAGMEDLQICATDEFQATTSVFVPLQVFNIEDKPVVSRVLSNMSIQEDETAELNISGAFNDVDLPYGDSLRIVWVGNASIPMYLDNDTMIVTFGPVFQMVGARDITFRCYDSLGYLAAQKITVTVVHTNHPPQFKTADRLDITMAEDTVNNSFNANDFFTDKDLFYTIEKLTFSGNSSAHINCSVLDDGKIVIAPEKDWYGSENCYVVATDMGNATLALQVAAVVEAVNDAPDIRAFFPNASEVTVNETETLSLSVDALDVDSPAANVKYAWFVDGNKTSVTGPNFTYAPDLNASGKHVIMVTMSDGEYTTPHSWTVPVFNKNQKPIVGIIQPKDGQVFAEGTMILFRSDAGDPDGDKLTYTWKEGNNTLGQARTLSWKFQPGNHTVTVYVWDGTDTTAVNITVFVASVPEITIISPQDRARFKTTDNIKFCATVSDKDGDKVTVQWRDGTKVLSTNLNFTKKLGKGTHYIKLNATDGRNGTEQEIVVVVEEAKTVGFLPGFESVLAMAAISCVALGSVAMRKRRR